MARKPITHNGRSDGREHDPRRRQRTPTQIEDARALQRRQQLVGGAPRRLIESDHDPDRGKVISLADAASTIGAAYPQLNASLATLAQLGGTNPLWGTEGEGQYPKMPKVTDTDAAPPKGMIGATGTPIYAGIVNDQAEYNADFYWRHAVRIYDEMPRSDPQVRLMLQLYGQPIRAAQPSVVPASDDPVDIEIASFAETCLLEGMEYETPEGNTVVTSWDDILAHALTMHQYGFALFELCYTVDADGFVKWSRWVPMLARTVWRWWTNPENDLVGVQQYTFREYKFKFVNVPIAKLLRFTHWQEGSNYDGISMLRAAYPPWFFKQQLQRIEAVAIERNSIIPVVAKLPPGAPAADFSAAQQIVENFRANERMGAAIPASWDIRGLEGMTRSSRGGIQVQPTIQYYDIQIARAFGGQFVNLGSTSTGARSLDQSQKRTFFQMLQGECEALEEVLNSAIRRLVDYNWTGVAIYPKIKFPSLLASEVADMAQAIQMLAQVQMLTPTAETEDAIRKSLGLPEAPRSEIENTNPTAPNQDEQNEQDGEGQGGDDGGDSGQQQQQQGDETPENSGAGDDDGGGSGDGDGGAEMRELSVEARLLREALDAAYGRDAVGRATAREATAIRLMGGHEPGYEQNRGPHGHWAAGDGREEGGGATGGAAGAGGGREQRKVGGGGGGGGGGAAGGGGGLRRSGALRESAAAARSRLEAAHEAVRAEHRANSERLALARGALARAEQHDDEMVFAHRDMVAHRDELARRVAQRRFPAPAERRAVAQANESVAQQRGYLHEAQRQLDAAQAEHDAAKAAHEDSAARLAKARSAFERAGGVVVDRDEHGQKLPFSSDEFATALAAAHTIGSEPGEARGGINSTRIANINGRNYIVKTEMNAARMGTTPERTAAHEVLAHEVANLVGHGEHVPAQSYHVVHNGTHYSVQSMEAGKQVAALKSAGDRAAWEHAVQSDPSHILLEYTLGGDDRHEGNVLFDRASGKITHVDFGYEFQPSALLHYSAVGEALTNNSTLDETRVRLPKSAIHEIASHSGQIEAAAAKYNLPQAETAALHARLGVMKQLDALPRPTMADLRDAGKGVDTSAFRPKTTRVVGSRAGRVGSRSNPQANPLHRAAMRSMGWRTKTGETFGWRKRRGFLGRLLHGGRS